MNLVLSCTYTLTDVTALSPPLVVLPDESSVPTRAGVEFIKLLLPRRLALPPETAGSGVDVDGGGDSAAAAVFRSGLWR